MNKDFINRARMFFIAAFMLLATMEGAMAAGYTANQGKIYDASGNEVQLRGINHFGFNTLILQPQYLWAMGWKQQIAQIKSMGFNAVRLPIVPDALYSNTPVNQLNYINASLNPDLIGKTPLQVLDMWMAEANRQGLYVLINFYSVSRKTQYPTWFLTNPGDYSLMYNNKAYSKNDWIRDLKFLASRYAHLSHFFAIDIYNEPHGLVRWSSGDPNVTDSNYFWKEAAEQAATGILASNPNLLIFVEGTTVNKDGIEQWDIPINWGENLQAQAYKPLNIPKDKLVLAPHTYGPDVYMKSTFTAGNFPDNLAADWHTLFGQFAGSHTVVIGEFGGWYGPGSSGQQDVIWQNALVDYLLRKNIRNTFYWSYTPNSSDTGGILDNDLNVRQDKLALLKRLWGETPDSPPNPGSPGNKALTVFTDDLANGWALSGWSATSLIQNQVVQSGNSAIKANAGAWGGLRLDSRDASWNWTSRPVSGYTHLSFDVAVSWSSSAAAVNALEVSMGLGWGTSEKVSDYISDFGRGKWYHVDIPVSKINPQSVSFDKIIFQNTGLSDLNFYVDNVQLVGGNGGSQPNPPTSGGGQLQSCANIMPLGDSIVVGFNGGFRNDLYTGLQQNNCGVSYVGTQWDLYTQVDDKDHEGHVGIGIDALADGVNSWMAVTQPNIIVLMVGTNDTAWWSNKSASAIGAQHNQLIDKIQAARPYAWIFVGSLPPQSSLRIKPNNVDRAVLTQQVNGVIRNNVNARVAAGERIRFVDLSPVLTAAEMYDGIHPNAAAHGKIAQKFLDSIRSVLAK